MCDLRFISLDSPGIIEVKFNIRSNFVVEQVLRTFLLSSTFVLLDVKREMDFLREPIPPTVTDLAARSHPKSAENVTLRN